MHDQSPSSSCGPCCRLFGSLVSSQQNHLSASEYGLWSLLALSDDLCRDSFDAPHDLWTVDGFSTDLFEKMYMSHRRAYRRIVGLPSAPVFDSRLDLGLGGAAVKKDHKLTPILEVLCRFGAVTSGLLDHERLRWLLLSSCRLLSCRGSPSLRLRFEDEYELPAGDGERASPWRAIRAGCR
jgi:hypothetical protein